MDVLMSFSAPSTSEVPRSQAAPVRKAGEGQAFVKSLEATAQELRDARSAGTTRDADASRGGRNGMEANKDKNTDVKTDANAQTVAKGETNSPAVSQEEQREPVEEGMPEEGLNNMAEASQLLLAVVPLLASTPVIEGQETGGQVQGKVPVAENLNPAGNGEVIKLLEQKTLQIPTAAPLESGLTAGKPGVNVSVIGPIPMAEEKEAFAVAKLQDASMWPRIIVDEGNPKALTQEGTAATLKGQVLEGATQKSNDLSQGQQEKKGAGGNQASQELPQAADVNNAKDGEKTATVRTFNEQLQIISNERIPAGPMERNAGMPGKVSINEFINMKNPMEQIAEKLDFKLSNGRQEVMMQLKPENLGQVRVMLQLHEGKVEGKFLAENQQVRQTIEGNMDQLKRQFEEQGLQVGRLSVSVGGSMDQQQWAGRQGEGNEELSNRNFRHGGGAGLDDMEVETIPTRDNLHREAGGNVSYAI